MQALAKEIIYASELVRVLWMALECERSQFLESEWKSVLRFGKVPLLRLALFLKLETASALMYEFELVKMMELETLLEPEFAMGLALSLVSV